MTHNLHAALAQARLGELRDAATARAIRRHQAPAVTERPVALEPISRDPFLDGLSGSRADKTLARDRA